MLMKPGRLYLWINSRCEYNARNETSNIALHCSWVHCIVCWNMRIKYRKERVRLWNVLGMITQHSPQHTVHSMHPWSLWFGVSVCHNGYRGALCLHLQCEGCMFANSLQSWIWHSCLVNHFSNPSSHKFRMVPSNSTVVWIYVEDGGQQVGCVCIQGQAGAEYHAVSILGICWLMCFLHRPLKLNLQKVQPTVQCLFQIDMWVVCCSEGKDHRHPRAFG